MLGAFEANVRTVFNEMIKSAIADRATNLDAAE